MVEKKTEIESNEDAKRPVKRFVMWRGYLYRLTMRITHKFNWHYAPPVYPNGDTQLWCKWCGFRQTIKKRGDTNKLAT